VEEAGRWPAKATATAKQVPRFARNDRYKYKKKDNGNNNRNPNSNRNSNSNRNRNPNGNNNRNPNGNGIPFALVADWRGMAG
jgi:hypothetical protein